MAISGQFQGNPVNKNIRNLIIRKLNMEILGHTEKFSVFILL